MSEIMAAMRTKCTAVRSLLSQYQARNEAGFRLAAICILQQFPNASELDWLAERLDPEKEKPFVGYQAAVALTQAVRSLPPSDLQRLENSTSRALALAERNPDDPPRINVLKSAIGELNSKKGQR